MKMVRAAYRRPFLISFWRSWGDDFLDSSSMSSLLVSPQYSACRAPCTTAVSLGTQTDPKATGGITIYDDSTPRPTSARSG